MPSYRRAGIAVACFALLAACATEHSDRVIFVLFDISGSTATDSVRLAYLRQFDIVLDSLRPGDRLVAGVITDRVLQQQSFPVRLNVPPFNRLTVNPRRHALTVRAAVDSARAQVEALLRSGGSVKTTPILEALQAAERVFEAYSASRKVLVIFSDMVEETRDHDFTRDALTPEAIQEIVQRYRSQDRLPDLSGVRVYALGAGVRERAPLAPERVRQIRDFWERYLSACGAEITDYGGTLIEFEPRRIGAEAGPSASMAANGGRAFQPQSRRRRDQPGPSSSSQSAARMSRSSRPTA